MPTGPRSRPVALAAAAAAFVAGCAATPPAAAPATDAPGNAVQTLSYAEHEDTVLDLHLPTVDASGTTVVLVHGGFWREEYRRDLMEPLVPSLLAAGHVVVNLEYRRVGGAGGWPTTLLDVAAGIDALATLEGVTERVAVVGHSAGGHLALWAAARHNLAADAPGADPKVRPCAAVAQAGVVHLASADTLGRGAVADLLGGTDPARLAGADPSALLPTGARITLVHGEADDVVPVAQSEAYLAAAVAAGDDVTLRVGPGDHFSVIDPAHDRWGDVLDALALGC